MKDIIIIPKCECHDIEMFLHKRKGRKGNWECLIKKRESNLKYKKTDKGKARDKRYWDSDKGKIASKKAHKKYSQTEKGKQTIRAKDKKYRESAHGFMKHYLTKRTRELGTARSKAESDLAEIHKQLKELGLEPR